MQGMMERRVRLNQAPWSCSYQCLADITQCLHKVYLNTDTLPQTEVCRSWQDPGVTFCPAQNGCFLLFSAVSKVVFWVLKMRSVHRHKKYSWLRVFFSKNPLKRVDFKYFQQFLKRRRLTLNEFYRYNNVASHRRCVECCIEDIKVQF